MIIRLSDKIWWGDRHSPAETTDAKSVLNVAQNLDDYYWPRIGHVAQTVPYFRIAKHDDDVVDALHVANIDCILDLIERNNWYPVLIHCQAGCHRSMTTAVYAQWRLQGKQGVDGIMSLVRQLLLNPGGGIYYQTFMAHMKDAETKLVL